MDLDDVALFVLAADHANISAAGRALGLSPAVASTRLARLEQCLGADLLRRSTRRVSLSLEGEAFLPFAREMLLQRDGAAAALGQGQASLSGTLRLAASSSFAQQHLIGLLPKFLELHPRLDLDLRLTDLPHDPIEGSYDLALRNAPLADSSLRGRKLADDQRILCASPAYARAHGLPSDPRSLRDHRLIGFGRGAAKPLLAADGREAVFDPKAGQRLVLVDDGTSQKLLTLAGCGISMNSLWMVHRELADGSLLRVLPEFVVQDQAALWLVYPSANVVSLKVRLLIDFLVKEIGERPPWHSV